MGTKHGPSTSRAVAAAHTRSKVLAVASDLFAEHGYEAVTIRQVAKAMGMSTGAVFVHFDGKDALFEAATGRKPPLVRIIGILKGRPPECSVGFTATDAAQLLADLVGTAGE